MTTTSTHNRKREKINRGTHAVFFTIVYKLDVSVFYYTPRGMGEGRREKISTLPIDVRGECRCAGCRGYSVFDIPLRTVLLLPGGTHVGKPRIFGVPETISQYLIEIDFGTVEALYIVTGRYFCTVVSDSN